jgi:hypothetical protein
VEIAVVEAEQAAGPRMLVDIQDRLLAFFEGQIGRAVVES